MSFHQRYFREVTLTEFEWQRIEAKAFQDPGPDHHNNSNGRTHLMFRQVWDVIAKCLTQRQQQAVELYFLRQLNESETAPLLGISQQSVHELLFGKSRNGVMVGGALRKLRKICSRRGIDRCAKVPVHLTEYEMSPSTP